MHTYIPSGAYAGGVVGFNHPLWFRFLPACLWYPYIPRVWKFDTTFWWRKKMCRSLPPPLPRMYIAVVIFVCLSVRPCVDNTHVWSTPSTPRKKPMPDEVLASWWHLLSMDRARNLSVRSFSSSCWAARSMLQREREENKNRNLRFMHALNFILIFNTKPLRFKGVLLNCIIVTILQRERKYNIES